MLTVAMYCRGMHSGELSNSDRWCNRPHHGPLRPPPNTIPEKFKDCKFYQHNPTVTLMRTTVEENRKLGEEIGRKAAAGPTCIMIQLKGVSAIDQTGKAFDDPEARQAPFDGIRAAHGSVELIELDCHINDTAFAEAAATTLLDKIRARSQVDNTFWGVS